MAPKLQNPPKSFRSLFSTAISSKAVLYLLIPSLFSSTESITCNSQYCPNYGLTRCGAILDCDFGVCYDRYMFMRPPAGGHRRWTYVESGCSTEFHPSMVGKCVGDNKRGYTCACNNASYCNYNHRQLEGADPHNRVTQLPLRQLTCLFTEDPVICHQHGFPSVPCNITNTTYCLVGRPAASQFVQRGSVDYVGYWERANAMLGDSQEWLCEEDEYERRWLCTCRRNGCSVNAISEDAMMKTIDRSTPTVKCRDYDSTRVDDENGHNRTCSGHVCYAEYDRTVMLPFMVMDNADSETPDVETKVTEVRVTLGCRNFSHPQLFYRWAYNKAYGNKQQGQMFCRSDMCNEFTLQMFKNASFRLEASAARSSSIALFGLGTAILALLLTAIVSYSSG